MDRKTILILGGGIGGQVAANALATRLKGRHRIVLVEKESSFTFSPSLLWLIVGGRKPAAIQRPINSLVRNGVELVQAEVLRIDPAAKNVETSKGPLQFDYLIICLGSELAPETIPGFQGGALNLYSLEGCKKIWNALQSFTGERVAVLVTRSPFKCPAAPYEAAFLIKDFLNKMKSHAEVAVFTPEPFPMPAAGPKNGEVLKQMLGSSNIQFYPNHAVALIDPEKKTIAFENGAHADFDLLIGIPPHRAPKVVRDSGLGSESGWIPVDRGTLATSHEGIYAIGDVATISIAGGKALPKAGVFAHAQAEVVAQNILAHLNRENPVSRFDGNGWCAIEMGNGRAAFGSGDFYAADGPAIDLYPPSRFWHLGKVLFEKWWLAPNGSVRAILGLAMKLGAKSKNIPVSM